jgi:hypothetical protein
VNSHSSLRSAELCVLETAVYVKNMATTTNTTNNERRQQQQPLHESHANFLLFVVIYFQSIDRVNQTQLPSDLDLS